MLTLSLIFAKSFVKRLFTTSDTALGQVSLKENTLAQAVPCPI